MPPRRKAAEPDTFVSYLRVSTEEQAGSGLGLEAQQQKIAAECGRRDWRLVEEFSDPGVSGGLRIEERPGLVAALGAIERGEAGGLIVAKLDRLSRSAADAAMLLERAIRERWSLVACDLGVDTSTPSGEVMANVMGAFARFEKRLIGQRTSEALQAKRLQGAVLGRPDRAPREVVCRACARRLEGASLRVIAAEFNRDDVATSQGGGAWRASSVAAVLARADARAILTELEAQ
jgi:DNA invertase Pin-like site-specific DNA recombinase